jgi:hypothetical protein
VWKHSLVRSRNRVETGAGMGGILYMLWWWGVCCGKPRKNVRFYHKICSPCLLLGKLWYGGMSHRSFHAGAKLEGDMGGCDTPPPQSTNHLDWQGKSSGLAGQSKILNDRM